MSGDERQVKRKRIDRSKSESDNNLSENESQLSGLSNYSDEKEKLEPTLEESDPPLHTAVITEDIDLIKEILSSGVDIDAFDKKYNTALHLAVNNECLPAIKCLLEYGASISVKNKSNNYCDNWETPLHIAVNKNRLDIVKLLLTTRVDVNKLIQNYETVLNYAFERKNFNLINYLIGNSYQANSKDLIKKASHTFSIQLLFDKDYHEDLRASLFGEYISINMRNSKCETPLNLAVINKNITMIEYLLDNGADLNANTINNYFYPTPLHTAVENNDENMVKFLLNYDHCNVNVVTNNNFTPLHIAVMENNLTIVKMLIEKKAKHDVYGRYKYHNRSTPFHIAVYKNLMEIAEYFLDIVKVDVNVKTEDGESALEAAAEANEIDMVKLLLNHGAIVDYFHNHPEEGLYSGGTPLHRAIRKKNVEMVDLLLSKGANVNVKLKNGTTALHVAIKSRNTEIIKRLLDRDIDVHAKMNTSRYEDLTPILQATEEKLIEIIPILIEKGANINDVAIFKSKSVSIIDIAVEYDYRSENLLSMLLNLGADINISYIYDKQWSNKDLKMLVEKHILKLKAAKLFVNEKLNGWISRGPREKEFFNECKKEVKKMQNEKINQSSFCYFDLFNQNAGAVAMYVETNSLVMEFYKLMAEFPLYAEMLTCRFQRALRINQILKNK